MGKQYIRIRHWYVQLSAGDCTCSWSWNGRALWPVATTRVYINNLWPIVVPRTAPMSTVTSNTNGSKLMQFAFNQIRFGGRNSSFRIILTALLWWRRETTCTCQTCRLRLANGLMHARKVISRIHRLPPCVLSLTWLYLVCKYMLVQASFYIILRSKQFVHTYMSSYNYLSLIWWQSKHKMFSRSTFISASSAKQQLFIPTVFY